VVALGFFPCKITSSSPKPITVGHEFRSLLPGVPAIFHSRLHM
jgi:hypothetical protein